MKVWKKLLLAALVLSFAGALAACGDSAVTPPPSGEQQPGQQTPVDPNPNPDPDPNPNPNPNPNPDPDPKPELKKITGITFTDKSFPYDRTEHTITIDGTLPQGVSVAYTQNKGTDAGVYNATAVLSGEGYETLTLNAKLTIQKATIEGITFEGASFPYDGASHSIEFAGQLPEDPDLEIVYSCKEDPSLQNSATETGTYTIVLTVTSRNYETLKLEATLKITASEDERHITYFKGKLYFANARHNDYLYSYDPATRSLSWVSLDVPYHFTPVEDELFFRSASLFASSIKEVNTLTGLTSIVDMVKGEYLCSDGNNTLYYVANGLTQSQSGIYRLTLGTSEPKPVLVSAGKAKYLVYADGKLYFADGQNGWKLSYVSATASNASRTMIPLTDKGDGEKIDALTVEEHSGKTYLFFTVNNLLGDYIANYEISGKVMRKLTMDSGANLTVVGDTLYYINTDLLTSSIFGDGIYSVDAYPLVDNSSMGEAVIQDSATHESYSSLTALDDGSLAYYRVSDQMLCIYNPTLHTTVEILNGFTPPEEKVLSEGSKIVAYGTKLYYLDLHNEKALYCIDTASSRKTPVRITSNKVADFSIVGDTLYFNAVSYGVNNDLYKLDLKQGGIPELVSTNDCKDIVSDGTNLFYIHSNASGDVDGIHKIDQNGADTEIYACATVGDVFGLTYYDGYLYFVKGGETSGGDLMRMKTTDTSRDAATVVYDDHHVGTFTISDGVVYFRELYGIGWASKQLSRINVDGAKDSYHVLAKTDTDPLEILVFGDKVYYYNDLTNVSKSGIYCVSKTAENEKNPTLVLANGSQYYARNLTIIGNTLYFISYRLGGVGGDSHLYSVDLTTKNVTKLA